MLATILPEGEGLTVKFERRLHHPREAVWSYLTDNAKLPLWFPELTAGELRPGGSMLFDMQDGNVIEMEIYDYEPLAALEFAWGEDRVRFEAGDEPDGCLLVLRETIGKLTDHTPKDLAGWHVCLDVIEALLDGKDYGDRKQKWSGLYDRYAAALAAYGKSAEDAGL